MLQKTREAIERRYEILPLHHIDTGVFFESQEGTKSGNACADYLNRVGYKYRGAIALTVLGEFMLVAFRDITLSEHREIAIRVFDQILRKRKIEFAVPSAKVHDIAARIRELDTRLEDTDVMHFATAVEANADVFVTTDTKLVGNQNLERVFRIRIAHPMNL